MIAIRNVRKIVLFAKVPLTPIHANSQSTALLNKTKPVQQIVTRNASIHTRNFLIQKFRLEHISNLGIALLAFPVASFALGIWQIQRKVWKENLISHLDKKMSMEPVDMPDNLEDLKSMEYQAVRVRGQFLHDKELYLGPRTLVDHEEDGEKKKGILAKAPKSGYLVITPFKLDGREETILVNRGWVPKNTLNPKSRPAGQVEGTVDILGVVRLNEPRPQFMPKIEGKNFLYRDLSKMCSMTGADPYFVDAKYETTIRGGPIGGQTTVSLRNEHLSYIFTWLSLSGLSGYFWYKLVYLIPK